MFKKKNENIHEKLMLIVKKTNIQITNIHTSPTHMLAATWLHNFRYNKDHH